MAGSRSRYEVFVAVDRFKFTASHFIAFRGYRERLHGHNYSVSLRLVGGDALGADGYVVDFGEIKTVVAAICRELNEHFILPARSDALRTTHDAVGKSWTIECEDGSRFVLPESDVAALPIVHSSAEEIAAHLWTRVVDAFSRERLLARGISEVEVTVAEAPNQQASFRRSPALPRAAGGEGSPVGAPCLTPPALPTEERS